MCSALPVAVTVQGRVRAAMAADGFQIQALLLQGSSIYLGGGGDGLQCPLVRNMFPVHPVVVLGVQGAALVVGRAGFQEIAVCVLGKAIYQDQRTVSNAVEVGSEALLSGARIAKMAKSISRRLAPNAMVRE